MVSARGADARKFLGQIQELWLRAWRSMIDLRLPPVYYRSCAQLAAGLRGYVDNSLEFLPINRSAFLNDERTCLESARQRFDFTPSDAPSPAGLRRGPCSGCGFRTHATERATSAGAAPPHQGSIRDIKHVVLLMQENRSFDHYFGTLAGVRGFDDADALKLPNGKSVFYQPDPVNPNGYLLPFHLDTRTTSAQKIPSTSHAWSVQHDAWNGGKMDNWMPAHRKADGGQSALRHGLSHARGHPVPVRAGRGVHDLRRLPLLRAWDRPGPIGCTG